MRHIEKEEILYFSILGKNRGTGKTTLSIRKETEVMAALQRDTQSRRLQKFREALNVFQPTVEILQQREAQLPTICSGCHLTRRGDSIQTKYYNGIVTVSINHCENHRTAVKLKKDLQQLPQTRAAFIGHDDKSLILLFRFLYPDGTLPVKQEAIRSFHTTAYRIATQYLRPYLPSDWKLPTISSPDITFHHTLDKDLFYNPQAESIIVHQPLHLPSQKNNTIPNNTLRLHTFMQQNYRLRYNTLKDVPEYCPLFPKEDSFKPIDQTVQNSMALDALEEGLNVWDRDIRRYLYSNRIPTYNPVEEFLKHTGKWDGKRRIKEISDCVKCDHPHWELLFRRWFLCMVANWQNRDRQYANCTSPLLIGKQGYRKSTFCRLLLPPELRFGFTDRLNMEEKRTAEMYLNRFLLINLDEFDQINDRQQAFLKHLLQKASPSIRKPYSPVITETRRYASFIGTSNMQQLLYDVSGSRRFLCVKVKERIDFPEDMDYRQLYAEILHALNEGERYWFNEEEETLLQTYNQRFETENKYAQLFWTCYRRPQHSHEGIYLSCSQILRSLCTPYEFSRLSNGHIANFGKLLQKWGLEKKHEEFGNSYKVVDIFGSKV